MLGFISYLNKKEGYGYISGYDDEKYYFEFSSIDFTETKLKVNLEVIFSPNVNGNMLYASDIKLFANSIYDNYSES